MYAASAKATKVTLRAHRLAVEAIKSASGNFPVGMTLALQDIQFAEDAERIGARMRKEINDVYLESLQGDDFVGVQSYSRTRWEPKVFCLPKKVWSYRNGVRILARSAGSYHPLCCGEDRTAGDGDRKWHRHHG